MFYPCDPWQIPASVIADTVSRDVAATTGRPASPPCGIVAVHKANHPARIDRKTYQTYGKCEDYNSTWTWTNESILYVDGQVRIEQNEYAYV